MTQQEPRTPDGLSSPAPHRPELPKRRWLIHLWIILGAAAILGVAWLAINRPAIQTTTTHTVLYEADADAATGGGRTGAYTMQTDSGGSSRGNSALPVTRTLTDFHTGDFVYLSVQNQDAAGSVTCRITVDGAVVSGNNSTGGYTIATCEGRVP